MGCCIELETPQSIKDTDGTDVFDEIVGDAETLTAMMKTKVTAALWARHRYKGLGSTDRTYWIQCMKDRLQMHLGVYFEKFKVYDAYMATDYTDLSDGSSLVVYEHEDTPDSDVEGKKYLSSRDTTSVKSFSGLPATTLRDDLEAVQDPYRDFAREFDDLFCGRM